MTATGATASTLSPAQADFIRIGTSVVVASTGADRTPSQARAVGCVVAADRRRVTVLLRRSQSEALLADIARCRALAVVFCQPSTHRTLQIKAADAEIREAPDADHDWLARQADAFHRELRPFGYTESHTRALLGYAPADLVAVSFSPQAVFSQTPGPRAGERVS